MPKVDPRANMRLKLSFGSLDVIQERAYGWAVAKPSIVVTPGQSGVFELDTFLHEALHMSRPDLSESEVSRIAGDLSKVAWAVGYRRPTRADRSD